MKKAIREVIVVEGRYDKNALSQVVDATIITLGGFAVFNDREKLAFLRRLAEQRGLIVLTDSDGAGFVIRNYLKGALPRDRVKQAYIPDIPGKERRKRTPGKEGKLGVEGMRPAVLLEALRRGVKVPEQIAVLGFNDLPGSDCTVPRLSSIRTPREAIGRRAAEQLLALIAGKEVRDSALDMGFELMAREST